MARLEDLRIDSPVPKPRRKRPSLLPWVVVAAAALWLGWRFGGESIQRIAVNVQPAREVQVYTVPAERGPEGSFTAGGYLEVTPPGPTVVSSLIDGQVRELHVKEGDRVSAGQLVARLDGSLLQADVNVQASRVEEARARLAQLQAGFRNEEVDSARAELRQSESRLAKARADYSRYQTLFAEGIVSRAEFDAFESALRQAEGEVESRQAALALLEAGHRSVDINIARQQLDSARAELARVQTVLAKTKLTAPASGVVLATYIQPGGWVSPTDGSDHAGQVCSIFDPRDIQAWVDVNQRDIGNVYMGQSATLVTDAYPDDPIDGKVTRILPSASLEKNTVRVNINLAEVPDYLRPEMSMQVTFKPKKAEGEAEAVVGVDIPVSAVVTEGGKSYVFVVAGGKAARREVELGAENGENVRITSGVGSGDQVITDPKGLADGQSVKIKQGVAE